MLHVLAERAIEENAGGANLSGAIRIYTLETMRLWILYSWFKTLSDLFDPGQFRSGFLIEDEDGVRMILEETG